MAGDSRLSARFGSDTTDFKTGISEINRELRVVESGFKASAAALGDWSDSATGLEQRITALNKEIGLQGEKVDALTVQYERMVEQHGANSVEAQNAQIALNKETETLNKMKVELGETQESLQEMATSEGDAAGAADNMGSSVEDAGGKIDSAGQKTKLFGGFVIDLVGAVKLGVDAIKGLANAVIGLGKSLLDLVFNTAEAADELIALSDKTGISTTRLQEMAYVADQVGTSQETITGSMTRLTRSMATATEQVADYNAKQAEAKKTGKEFTGELGDAAAAFKTLGVSVTDANGNLRDNEDVFNDVITALGSVENEAQRDAIAMAIFGKSATELNPLIKAGSDELARLALEAHSVGAVMGEDTVEAFGKFADTTDSIKAGITGLLGQLAGAFLPIFQQVADAVKGALPQIQAALQSADIKDFISNLGTTIGTFIKDNLPKLVGFFKTFLKEGIPAIVSFAKNILTNVIPAILKFATWLTTVAVPAVQGIIKGIKDFIVALTPWMPLIVAVVAALGTLGIIVKIVAFVQGLVAAFTALSAAGLLPVIGIGLLIAAIVALGYAIATNMGGIRDKIVNTVTEIGAALTTWWAGVQTGWNTFTTGIKANWDVFWSGVSLAVGTFTTGIQTTLKTWHDNITTAWNNFTSGVSTAWNNFWTGVGTKASEFVESVRQTIQGWIDNIVLIWNGLISTITTAWNDFWTKVQEIAQGIVDSIVGIFSIDWGSIGSNIVNGIIGGLSGAAQGLLDAAADLAQQAYDALAGALGIQSPSKKFAVAGRYSVEGLIQGLQQAAKAMLPGEMSNLESQLMRLSRVPIGAQGQAQQASGRAAPETGAIQANEQRGSKEYQIIINNPAPEPASTSIDSTMKKLAFLGVTA